MRTGHGARRCVAAGGRVGAAGAAGREPVLKQVDLPHSYYWRELYLPQLTTGPSSVSFMPDGEALVYSMAGSLWRQRIGDRRSRRTDPRQRRLRLPARRRPRRPQRRVHALRRRRDGAVAAGSRAAAARSALTRGGAVNVEPRLSPDGKRIAWVSTQGTGHFNLFVADIGADGLRNARPLLGERKSAIDRYYYSAVRPRDQSVVVAGRQAHRVRRQPRGRLGQRRHLVGVGGRSRRAVARSCARKPPGARARSSRRTASACCSPATTAASRTSSG